MLNFGGEIAKAFEYAVLSEIGYYAGRRIFRITNYITEISEDYIIYTVDYSGSYPPNFGDSNKLLLNFNSFVITKTELVNWDIDNNQIKFKLLTNESLPDYFIEETHYDDLIDTTSGMALLQSIQFPMRAYGDVLYSYLKSYLCSPTDTISTTKLLFPRYITNLKTTTKMNKDLINAYYSFYSGALWLTEPDFLFKRGLVYFTEAPIVQMTPELLKDDLYVGAYIGNLDWGHSFIASGDIDPIFHNIYLSGDNSQVLPAEKTFVAFLYFLEKAVKEFITDYAKLKENSYTPEFSGSNWWCYNKNKMNIKHNDFYINQNIFNYGNIFFKYDPPIDKVLPAEIIYLNLSGDVLTTRYRFFNTTYYDINTAYIYRWNNSGEFIGSGSMNFISGNVYETQISGVVLTTGDYINVRCGEENPMTGKGIYKRISDLSILYL